MKITYERDYPCLGERIKSLRESSPKSLTQLAADAGISTPHWHRIEKEKIGALPLETLKDIEQALEIDLGISFE
jgi:transcriptional regulator with XRE-family HTH domain